MSKSLIMTVRGRLLLDGFSIKGWAEEKGYKMDTVYKTLYGSRGKTGRGLSRKIKEDLQRDGYWPKDDEHPEVANG